MARAGPALTPLIARKEFAQPLRLRVERREEVSSALGLVLHFAGPQGLGERPPKAVEPGIRHLEKPADIGRLARSRNRLVSTVLR